MPAIIPFDTANLELARAFAEKTGYILDEAKSQMVVPPLRAATFTTPDLKELR